MDSGKRKYESVVVFDGFLGEDVLNGEVAKVKGLLASNGAVDLQVAPWGKQEIKYEVNGKRSGLYVEYMYSSENHGIIDKLNQILAITDSVLLFQSHRISDRVRKFKGRPVKKTDGGSGSDIGEAFVEEELV